MTLEYLKKIIEKKYLHRGDYTLSSGQKSDKYFDIKGMLGYRVDKNALLDGLDDYPNHWLLSHLQKDLQFKSIGGIELGGALLVASLHTMIHKCFIRKADRDHGLKKMIEGHPVSPILLVDDVISTGDTIQTAINFCELSKHKVAGILCAINRSGLDNINNLPIHSLFVETDFN